MDNVKQIFGTKVALSVDEHWYGLLDTIEQANDQFNFALVEALQVYGGVGKDFRYGLDYMVDEEGAAHLCTRYDVFTPATETQEGLGNKVILPRLNTFIHVRKGPEGSPPKFKELHPSLFMQKVLDYIPAVDGLVSFDKSPGNLPERPGMMVIYVVLTGRLAGGNWKFGEPTFTGDDMQFDVYLPRFAWYRVTFKYGTLLAEHRNWLKELSEIKKE